MRKTALVAALLVLLLVPSAAHGEELSKYDAYLVTASVAERRHQIDAFAYRWGVYRCLRLGESWVKCRGFIRSYRGGGNDRRHECLWWTFVTRREGQLLYRVGPTECHRL